MQKYMILNVLLWAVLAPGILWMHTKTNSTGILIAILATAFVLQSSLLCKASKREVL